MKKIKRCVNHLNLSNISDDRAFNHLILTVFYYQKNIGDQAVTDGKDDGGIDFIFYNDEENKLTLGQSKFTEALSLNDMVAEYNKMYSTYLNFVKGNTGIYNETLKRELRNAIDRLPDDNSGSVEYCIFTTADNVIDEKLLISKIETKLPEFPIDSIRIYNGEDIENAIDASYEKNEIVPYYKIKIDKPNNCLIYDKETLSGIMCNVKSSSIMDLYDKYQNNGLFDLNIRRYVPNKMVDSAIKRTLDNENERENFWFFNNGIIIACEKFEIDGDTIKLWEFSIVNGGQTTHLIGNYKGRLDKNNDFEIPCKIVAVKNRNKAPELFNKIAQASNSQKPILPRDLRSNSKEMVHMAKWLASENIYLEIKRGSKKPKKQIFNFSIKNDELGQLILSFVHQRPGTARSGKRSIFDNSDLYGRIFRAGWQKVIEKQQFLIDLIRLNYQYGELEKSYKESNTLSPEQTEILKNGKQMIFAMLGLYYMLANGDTTEVDILKSQQYMSEFRYGPILSNYKNDDIYEKLDNLIFATIDLLSQYYGQAFEARKVTSVSNFMKTDLRYYDDVVKVLINSRFRYDAGKAIKNNWDIFIR